MNMQFQNETLGKNNIQKADEEEKPEKQTEKECSESKKSNGRVLWWEGRSTVVDDEKRPNRIRPAEKMPVVSNEEVITDFGDFQ